MQLEKKLIKKVLKNSLTPILPIILIISLFLSMVTGILSSNSSSNDYSFLTDIGALGVPQEYIKYFNEVASQFNIPNWVLAGIAKQESGFNPRDSYAGAYGIMQFQKYDTVGGGGNLWSSALNEGLGDEYKKAGYKFNHSEDMWSTFLKDVKAQIIAGAYELRYYFNYVLYKKNKVPTLNYNSNENLNLIQWNSDANNQEFKELLRRTFACYNGGPGYGMKVNLDRAQNNYPNKVYQYCMEFRGAGLTTTGSNDVIEKAISAGSKWVGHSPYVWGGGRTESDVNVGRFDCSSFVHYCYCSAGITLGDRGSVTTFSLLLTGKTVSASELKRGDVIFFNTYTVNGHVGIFLGNGMFMHDSSSKGVTISRLDDPYFSSVFNGQVRRIVN